MKKLYRVIYLYREDNTSDYKIGKADRIAESPLDCAKIRIKEQNTAAIKNPMSFIDVYENTNLNVDSLTIESFIHNSLEDLGYERLHRKIHFPEGKDHDGLTEWFRMKYLSEIEVKSIIRNLHKQINGKPGQKSYVPRFYQDVVSAIKLHKIDLCLNENKSIELGTELAPRFGKTLFSLNDFMILHNERNIQLFLLPAYVLSAHSSFSKEISSFSNFCNIIQLNANSETFEEDLNNAKLSKNPIVVYVSLSMENFDKYSRAMSIFTKEQIYTLIDESDFGAHTEHSKKILNLIPSIITERTTGTFIERALRGIDVNDNVIIWTQTDMQMIKNGTHPILNLLGKETATDNPRLNKVLAKWTREDAIKSCAELPKIIMLKQNLSNIISVQSALENLDKFGWSKCLKDVNGNWQLLSSLFKALYDRPNMNIADEIFSSSRSIYLGNFCPLNVSMIFGGFPDKKQQKIFCTNLQNMLGNGFLVVLVNGDVTTNKKAEEDVKRKIASMKLDIQNGKIKKIILVSRDMAARSFSIPEIDTVLLMYDKGMISQTSQKISRAFTPGNDIYGNEKTACYIVSLALDAERTHCPIDLFIIREAARISESFHENENILPVIKNVANCYNIFRNDENKGYIPFELDEYSSFLLEGSADDLLRIAASTIDINVDEIIKGMDDELITLMSTCSPIKKADKSKGSSEMILKNVKAYFDNKDKSSSDAVHEQRIKSFKEKIIELIKNINFCTTDLCMFDNYEHSTIEETIESLYQKKDLHIYIQRDLGIDIKLIKYLMHNLNKTMLNTALALFKTNEYENLNF